MTEELSEDPKKTPAGGPNEAPTDDPDDDRSIGSSPGDDAERCELRPDDHLQDLPDGSGCTEIWEHIAEQRADDD